MQNEKILQKIIDKYEFRHTNIKNWLAIYQETSKSSDEYKDKLLMALNLENDIKHLKMLLINVIQDNKFNQEHYDGLLTDTFNSLQYPLTIEDTLLLKQSFNLSDQRSQTSIVVEAFLVFGSLLLCTYLIYLLFKILVLKFA